MLAREDRKMGPPKRGPAWHRRLAYAALVLVLVSGTAMAGMALVVQIRQRGVARLDSDRPAAPGPKRHRMASTGRAEREEVESSPTPREHAPEAVEPTPATADLAPTEVPVQVRGEDRREIRAETSPGARVAVNRHRSAPGSLPPRAERAPADAATLLGQAEEAESTGRLAGASRLYGELRRWFPGTREEIVARALHAQLLLDRLGNPARALALFEGYLDAEPGGTLAEEARLGRARAFERLGRPSEERSAWLELLRAHPRSVHAAGARARLSALDRP
jgi:hypothetical protein